MHSAPVMPPCLSLVTVLNESAQTAGRWIVNAPVTAVREKFTIDVESFRGELLSNLESFVTEDDEFMNYGLFNQAFREQVPVKHKVFVSYHHGNDQKYYDAFSKSFHDIYDVIYDNSLERRVDSDNVDYVMRRIRENYITGSSCTIVLIGEKTWGRKYVDWEIKATLEKGHGLIGVYLPTAARSLVDNSVIVPDRLHDNIESGYALWLSWEQITASDSELERYIAAAKARSKTLIANDRDRRLRNA